MNKTIEINKIVKELCSDGSTPSSTLELKALACKLLFFEDKGKDIEPFSTIKTAGLVNKVNFEIKLCANLVMDAEQKTKLSEGLSELVNSLEKDAKKNCGRVVTGTFYPFEKMSKTAILMGEYTTQEYINVGEDQIEVLLLLPIYESEEMYFKKLEYTNVVRRLLAKSKGKLHFTDRDPITLNLD